MAIDIKIKQGLFGKKKLNINLIDAITDKLGLKTGISFNIVNGGTDDLPDGIRKAATLNGIICMYNAKFYGRGFDIEFIKGIELRFHQPIPATTWDINDFYNAVKIALEYVGQKKFEQDGAVYTIKQIEALKNQQYGFVGEVLSNNKFTTLPSTVCNVELPDKFYQSFSKSQDKQKFFDEYLNNFQSDWLKEDKLKEYTLSDGWKISFPRTWRHVFGDHHLFYPENFEPTVHISSYNVISKDGKPAPADALRADALRMKQNDKEMKLKNDFKLKNTQFLSDFFEGKTVENGKSLFIVQGNICDDGFLFIVTYASKDKQCIERSLCYLNTVTRGEKELSSFQK
jgi:hypothetical protein